MPTIKTRKQANGATRYTAIVRHRSQGTILHREVALEDPAELTRLRISTPTLAELIRWYIDTFETISRWQRSKQTHLEFLERHPLGKTIAHKLTSADLIRHVQSRRREGTGPATVINDLIWMGVVLRAAKSVREYFKGRDRRAEIPMPAVMDFAIASARRESKICRLEWRDNDAAARTGMVRDAKHPTGKEGNHRRFKYTPEAWALVNAQARTSEYIFPYDPKNVGAAFTRACHLLGIEDLRHEAMRTIADEGIGSLVGAPADG